MEVIALIALIAIPPSHLWTPTGSAGLKNKTSSPSPTAHNESPTPPHQPEIPFPAPVVPKSNSNPVIHHSTGRDSLPREKISAAESIPYNDSPSPISLHITPSSIAGWLYKEKYTTLLRIYRFILVGNGS